MTLESSGRADRPLVAAFRVELRGFDPGTLTA